MIEHVPGGTDVPARIVRGLARTFVRTTLTVWPLRGPMTKAMLLVDAVFAPVPRLAGTEFEQIDGGSWRGELVRPAGSGAEGSDAKAFDGAVLYMHGGAFLFCGLRSHRRVVERLSLRTGLPVLSVDYRQLPVAHHSDTLDDCVDAWRHLVEQGYDPSRIVLAGDSAGGHLAFSVALYVARVRGERPAGVIGFSPWLDFDAQNHLAHPNRRSDAMLPATRLERISRLCVGADDVDPALSPVNGDLTSLPPVLVICASDEVLRHDAELMEERLEAAGVESRLLLWDGMVHAFPVLGHALRDSARALDVAADFIRQRVGAVAGVVTEEQLLAEAS